MLFKMKDMKFMMLFDFFFKVSLVNWTAFDIFNSTFDVENYSNLFFSVLLGIFNHVILFFLKII